MANASCGNKLHLEAIDRIGSIPLVESSLKHAGSFYGKVKNNNRLFTWYFETAETTIFTAYETLQPAVKLFDAPLKRLDNVMCKSLDILEQRLPLVYLPPEMMFWNTKLFMNDHLVKPVLKRADSVLENPLTTYAADRIDVAFTAGDKFVDKYLVPFDDEQDQTDAPNNEEIDKADAAAAAAEQNEKGAIKAIHHGQRFSRKLKRRLTQRTLAEARALKKQSQEAIHILIYAAELIATDPKLALQKGKELWAYLSQDEPENQARPVTLEQLIVLLTRESARRMVHLLNFSVDFAANIPKTLALTSTELVHHVILINNRIMTITHLDKLKQISKEEAESLYKRIIAFYTNLYDISNEKLERLAKFLSGRIEAEKVSGSNTINSSRSGRRRQTAQHQQQHPHQDNNTVAHNNINGVY